MPRFMELSVRYESMYRIPSSTIIFCLLLWFEISYHNDKIAMHLTTMSNRGGKWISEANCLKKQNEIFEWIPIREQRFEMED